MGGECWEWGGMTSELPTNEREDWQLNFRKHNCIKILWGRQIGKSNKVLCWREIRILTKRQRAQS